MQGPISSPEHHAMQLSSEKTDRFLGGVVLTAVLKLASQEKMLLTSSGSFISGVSSNSREALLSISSCNITLF